jgi:hypothetical protein
VSTPLDPAAIAKLLKEEAEQPTRTRKPKEDLTKDRTINGWFRLAHHICTRDCPHRVDPNNPTYHPDPNKPNIIGNACWNPNCMDRTRDKDTDRGAQIVYEVKGQNICRYCYLGGYLSEEE